MAERRDQIVKRVVHALDRENDATSLVRRYFDDHEVLTEAARQTLEATREDVEPGKIGELVDRELVEALRFPASEGHGFLPALYLGRKRIAFWSTFLTLGSALALLLL